MTPALLIRGKLAFRVVGAKADVSSDRKCFHFSPVAMVIILWHGVGRSTKNFIIILDYTDISTASLSSSITQKKIIKRKANIAAKFKCRLVSLPAKFFNGFIILTYNNKL